MKEEIYYLTCTTDNHNKFYEIIIKPNTTPDGYELYDIYTRYGPIGKKGKTGLYLSKCSYSMAKNEADLLIKTKIKKGYTLFQMLSSKQGTTKTEKEEQKPEPLQDYDEILF